jgi:transcriptional regulator with XRE-family HTH domain
MEVVCITYHQDTIAAGLCQAVQDQGMRKFGEKVSRLRKQRGLSYRELAALLETSHSHLVNIESGKHQPSVELIERMVRFFGVSFDQLMDDEIDLEC